GAKWTANFDGPAGQNFRASGCLGCGRCLHANIVGETKAKIKRQLRVFVFHPQSQRREPKNFRASESVEAPQKIEIRFAAMPADSASALRWECRMRENES